jgi:hypothetical protein
MKVNVPLATGYSLRWFDAASTPESFYFTPASNSVEVLCGTTSLGHTSLTFGTNSIKVEVPTVTNSIANAGVCEKEKVITI